MFGFLINNTEKGNGKGTLSIYQIHIWKQFNEFLKYAISAYDVNFILIIQIYFVECMHCKQRF